MNQTHEHRKLHNLCRDCGEPKEDTTKSRCASCRAKGAKAARERSRKKRADWKAAGLCMRCGAVKEDPLLTKCAKCLATYRKESKAAHASGKSTNKRRVEAGLCYDCGVDVSDQPGIRCPVCKDKNAKRAQAARAKRKQHQQCIACPEPAQTGKTLCTTCADNNTDRNAEAKDKRVEGGVCRWCPSPATHESTACEYHFVYNLLKNWGRAPTSEEVDAVWTKLEGQNFECFYTGTPLVPGENASIEHVFPRKRYPDDVWTLDNLVWCDLRINRLKGDMTPEELGNFAKRIQERLPKILAVRLPNRE